MKIAQLAREIVALANELDGVGHAAAADSLDTVLRKIAVLYPLVEDLDKPTATKQPEVVKVQKPSAAKPKSPSKAPAAVPPVFQKPGQSDQYYSARIKKEDIAAMNEQQLLSYINFYDKMISSAKKSDDTAYVSVLMQNRSELALELNRKRYKSPSPEEADEEEDDPSTMTEYQKTHMEDYLKSKEKNKKNLQFLGGKARIKDFTQEMIEMGYGDLVDELTQEIRFANNTSELENIESLMGFFEELKNNPHEKSLLQQMKAKHGPGVLGVALEEYTSGKGVSVIQDMYKNYDQFVNPNYIE